MATFAVASASEIKATASTGATTGLVEVVTRGRTLKSNKQFTGHRDCLNRARKDQEVASAGGFSYSAS